MSPRDELLTVLKDAPDSQIDKSICLKLEKLIGASDEAFKPAIHEILDNCAHGALASDQMMVVMDML